jgi:hypothetical protein
LGLFEQDSLAPANMSVLIIGVAGEFTLHGTCSLSILTGDFLLVPFEGKHLLHHPDVINLYQTVLGSCQKPITILVPTNRVHSSFVDVTANQPRGGGGGGEGGREGGIL